MTGFMEDNLPAYHLAAGEIVDGWREQWSAEEPAGMDDEYVRAQEAFTAASHGQMASALALADRYGTNIREQDLAGEGDQNV